MSLLTSHSDANVVVEEALTVTYSQSIIQGSWGYTSANVSGWYTTMRECHRYARKSFRYVGMTHDAAKACRDAMVAKFTRAFRTSYWNSSAMGGGWVDGTKVVLEDGIAIGGKSLREIYEVVNHKKAYQYVKDCIKEGVALDEKIVKEIHALLMENILVGGVYRREEVVISGASHTPPAGNEMYTQIKNFYMELAEKSSLNGIELAAWTHAEFVRIHPFLDGNGRTSRLLMNYQLLKNGFLPVSVAKEDRLDYYNALDKYAAEGDLQPFMELVATLEETQLDKYLSHVPK